MIDLKSNKKVSIVYVTCTILVAAFYLFPQMRILIRFDQIAYLTALYIICFVVRYVNFNLILNLLKYAIPFCLLMFVAKGLDFKYGFLHNFMSIWNLVIPSIICISLFHRNRPRELFIITWSAIIMLLITCFITLTAIGETQNVMRELTAGTTDEDYAMGLREMGVGGYGIAYAMGAFTVGLFSLLQQMEKYDVWKYVVLILFVFSFYFITQAQFATLLIITSVGVATTYWLNANTIGRKLEILVATLILIFVLPLIVDFLIDIYKDSPIGSHLSQIYETLWRKGNEASVASSERSQYQINAFSLFLKSPIWGNNITQQPNAFIHLACHSTLLAVACSTGIIGIWSYIKTFHTAFDNEIKLIIAQRLHKSYYSIVLYYLLFAILNPIDTVTEASWVIFVLIPSLFKLYIIPKS